MGRAGAQIWAGGHLPPAAQEPDYRRDARHAQGTDPRDLRRCRPRHAAVDRPHDRRKNPERRAGGGAGIRALGLLGRTRGVQSRRAGIHRKAWEAAMTRFPRRRILQMAAATVAAPALPQTVCALGYPTRPLRWIVGFPPGGGADTVSRIMAQWLSERLGQSIVIENKPGASTNISIQAAVSSPPDGYTLLFIADAKDNPDKISMASFGTGSTSHVAGELFQTMTGIRMVHVPYRGEAPALTDMIAGQVQVMFPTLTGSLQHIRSGALRLLAVAGKTRSEFVPDAPTVGETVPGYEANSWCGLGVPRGTPADIITRLNQEINAGLADPATKARLAAVGTTPIFHTPSSFGAYVASEVEKWGKVIKASGARPE